MVDLAALQECEQKLLASLQAATEVVTQLNAPQPQDAASSEAHVARLRALCEQFTAGAKESQAVLLDLAAKYDHPLPYERSSYISKLRTLAAAKQVEAAQARLQQAQQAQQVQQAQQAQQVQQAQQQPPQPQ